jgi:hypothetical protein
MLTKKTALTIPDCKVGTPHLFADDVNEVTMRIPVKIASEKVEYTVTKLRAALEATFLEILGFRFKSIEFRVITIKTEHKPDEQKIAAQTDAYLEELKVAKEETAARYKLEEEAEEKAEKEEQAKLIEEIGTEKEENEALASDAVEEIDLNAEEVDFKEEVLEDEGNSEENATEETEEDDK